MANSNTEHSKALRRAAASARFAKGKAEGVTLSGVLLGDHAVAFKELAEDMKKSKMETVRFLIDFYSANK